MRQWSAAERQRRRRTAQRQAESAAPLALAKPDSNTDRGFINSDWALIFMLRMGLMSVQMMSESARSLANIGAFKTYVLLKLSANLKCW